MNEKYPSEVPDFYSRLGINPDANYEEIKSAYRRAAIQWHPDRNPSTKERAHIEFIAISEAFDNLSKRFNRTLHKDSESKKGTYDYYNDIFRTFFGKDYELFLKVAEENPTLKIMLKIFKGTSF
jgi:DnaJ-class molecular chaperone